MSSRLDNLVSTGVLHKEPRDNDELAGLKRSGSERLHDAANTGLALSSRFDLAYNAAHALALAALRYHGYRPNKQRYIVFQVLEETLQLPSRQWKVLDKAHNDRNRSEYEGDVELDHRYVEELISIVVEVEKRVTALVI